MQYKGVVLLDHLSKTKAELPRFSKPLPLFHLLLNLSRLVVFIAILKGGEIMESNSDPL